MDVQKIAIEVWQNLGKDTELQPVTDNTDESTFDISTTGAVKLLQWINRAYRRIYSWKDPSGRLIKFPGRRARHNFKTTTYSGTASSGSTTTVVLPAGFSSVDDYYNDWIWESDGGTGSGQRAIVADYVGSTRTITFHKTLSTAPDSTTTFDLYKNFFEIVPTGHAHATDSIVLDPVDQIASIIKIIDLEDNQEVPQGGRTDTFAEYLTSDGDPSQFIFEGNRIVFNYGISTARWFRLEYIKMPTELTVATDEPDMPSAWHEVIIAYATWIGLKQRGEHNEAWAWRQDMERLIQTLQQPEDLEFEREDCGITIDFDREIW